MRIIKTFSLLMLALNVACGSTTDDKKIDGQPENGSETEYKRYGIKSAIVEYEIHGMRTGTEKLLFDNWGAKEAKYEKGKISVAGFTVEDNKLSITDGEWTYTIDLKANTGSKIKTPFIDKMAEAAGTNDLTEIGERIMRSMGGKIIGQEEILGKQCDIWEIKSAGSKSWVWNWVTLKTEVNFMGNSITITAVRFEEDASIPASTFEIPDNVTISDGPDLNSIMNMIKGGAKKER